jgi:hypothetical protein
MMVGSVVAAGCIPPTTGGGTTTTVGTPPVGCLNGTANDFLYSGTPNVEGNLVEYASTNGTCTGAVVDATGTVVIGAGEPAATAECSELGRDDGSAFEPTVLGITMPADHWICTDN